MATDQKTPITILVAEDDDDDFLLMERAFKKIRLNNTIERVSNGQELLDYLRCQGSFSDVSTHPAPHLILLDLNMPLMDGREALEKIKSDESLRHFVVIVLTTSQQEEDRMKSYKYGANSFIRKPVKYDAFIEAVRILNRYWFEIVDLPEPKPC